MKICPQCKHPEHLPLKEKKVKNDFIYDGGCPILVFLSPIKSGGYYHEHCDCDYKKEIRT